MNIFARIASMLAIACLYMAQRLPLQAAESQAGSKPEARPDQDSPVSLEALEQFTVFSSGQEDYHTFRIPAAAESAHGVLLAFAEGRKAGAGDSGNVDLVLKRSLDQGRTWGPLQTIWDDGANTCGNPCAVVDRTTGVIWLLLTWNRGDDREPEIIAQTSHDTRRVFVTSSTDDGQTWAAPREITADVKDPGWTWYATGPGAGIQLERGLHRGRLIIPCDHIESGSKGYYSHVIYSDDHGRTWRRGGNSPQAQVNECEVVELADGRLMLNMRNYDRSQHTRQIAFSHDGGITWTNQQHAPQLVEPVCQASIRRFSRGHDEDPGLLLFSNPASLKRERMTVRGSRDDGQSWPLANVLFEGPAAYSCLVVLADGRAGCLYERGSRNPYETIVFARFRVDWLKAGADDSAPSSH